MEKMKSDSTIKLSALTKQGSALERRRIKTEKLEEEYRSKLKQVNQAQVLFYTQEMPFVLGEFEALDTHRTSQLKEILSVFAMELLTKPPVYQTVAEGMIQAADVIDAAQDVALVCSSLGKKTPMPADLQFEEPPEGELPSGASSGSFRESFKAKVSGTAKSSSSSSSTGGGGGGGAAPPPIPTRKKPTKGKHQSYQPGAIKVEALQKVHGLSNAQRADASAEEQRVILNAQLDELKKAQQSTEKAKSGLEALSGMYANGKKKIVYKYIFSIPF